MLSAKNPSLKVHWTKLSWCPACNDGLPYLAPHIFLLSVKLRVGWFSPFSDSLMLENQPTVLTVWPTDRICSIPIAVFLAFYSPLFSTIRYCVWQFSTTKKHNFGSDLLNCSSSWGSEIGWLELCLPWNGSPPNSTPSHSNPRKYWSCQVASSCLIRDSEMKTCLKGLLFLVKNCQLVNFLKKWNQTFFGGFRVVKMLIFQKCQINLLKLLSSSWLDILTRYHILLIIRFGYIVLWMITTSATSPTWKEKHSPLQQPHPLEKKSTHRFSNLTHLKR